MFLFQMDPTRISKEHAHCVRTLFGHQESTDLHDASFESQEAKLMPESCRSVKQALQRAVQRVSGTVFLYFMVLLKLKQIFLSLYSEISSINYFLVFEITPEVLSRIVLYLLINLVVSNQFCIQAHSILFFKKGRFEVVLRKQIEVR